jgi:Uma2 family endonuclease
LSHFKENQNKMPSTVKKKATYEDLCALPDNMVGEIISGELVATPRPGPRHTIAASALGSEICGPFQLGKGGPGGWWILDEPEIHLSEHIVVPDLAGRKKERLPKLPEENWFSIAPDWICEILSPSTIRNDRTRKMPIYAEFKVPHLWLIDPTAKTLEVFKLVDGGWMLASSHVEDDKVRAEPFQEVEIELALLWA